MISPKFIRENPKEVKESIKKRRLDISIVEEWLSIDEQYRKAKAELDAARHKHNVISEEINKLKKEKKQTEANKKITEVKAMLEKIKTLEEKIKQLEHKLNEITLTLPNIVSKGLPEKEKIISTYGKQKKEKWQKEYLEICKNLCLIEFDSVIRMSGEGFYALLNEGAELRRALIDFCLDSAKKSGYKEVSPPLLLNEIAVISSGHLPKFKEGMYQTKDGFYLSPTEEVALLNLYANKTLKAEQLPTCLTSYTPSFRTEKGATKGIFRTHQFDEVELFKFTKQEQSNSELKKMLDDVSKQLKLLKLPFRIKLLPANDIATQSHMTYDIDVFSPLSGWLEVSSCSNCIDFQARRAKITYMEGNEKKFVHTLNGTGLGLNRIFIAIIENYQQKDGSVKMPDVLQKYLGFSKIEKR